MGLFGKGDKKSNAEPKNVAKQKKEKKSMFGGKKKELTLIERMQLEESVAAASLDVVQELADNGGAAVRELEDGLLIVAFTNEMLVDAGLDPASEEFGSFAEALRSETVESIALADDLGNGIIGIIPSQETLLSLDEFDFVQDIAFQWAIVPFDLDDSDRLTLLDDTVHIARLVELANDSTIELDVKNGEVIEVSGGDQEDDEDENEDAGVMEPDYPEDEPELDADFPLDVGSDDADEFDAGLPPVDEFDAGEPFDSTFDDADNDGFEDFGETDGDNDSNDFGYDPEDLDDNPEYAEEQELMSAEELKAETNRVVNHSFANTELGLSIDMSKFDDYFDSVVIAQFDATRVDDGELQTVLSKLRQDANTELSRFHQDNIQSLRNKFTTSMRDIHNKLTESLDHKDENTTYGSKYYEIEQAFEDQMRDIDREVAGVVSKINEAYNEHREEYGENAKREAFAVYDSRYRPERDRKISIVRDNVQTDLKTTRDTELGELYQDRRTIAQRLFDKATTALLQTLQEEHQAISNTELRMYDAFRKDMDVYLRRHFADEVLRAKAEAEKLRQSHEADRVRQEYDQMLSTKARQLQEADNQARDRVNQLEQKHREQLDSVKADYDDRLERERKDNEDLRKMLQAANENSAKIGEQKDKEVASTIKTLENQIKSQERELGYANDRTSRSQKPIWLMTAAIAFMSIAVGVVAGFLFGAGSVELAPAAPVQQAAPSADSVSYHAAPSVLLFETEYNQKDAA